MIPNVKPNVLPNVLPNVIWDYGAPVATITTTKVGTFTIALRGTNGVDVTLDMGDGSFEVMSLLGTGTWVVLDHDYFGGTHAVKILDNYDNINYLSAEVDPSVIDFDVSPIPNFHTLFMANNAALSDVSSLRNTAVSTTLYIINNAIIDISPVVLTDATSIYLQGNPVVYTGYTWKQKTSGIYRFQSTVTTSGEVDQWLIDLNDALWTNCTIYLDGTNPARTAASDAAVAALVLRGCTLHLN